MWLTLFPPYDDFNLHCLLPVTAVLLVLNLLRMARPKVHLKCPKDTSIRLTLNYRVCNEISAYIHPYDTNTFTHSLTRMHLLQLKIHNIWIELFLNPKIIYLLPFTIYYFKPFICKRNSTIKSYINYS